jgi:hypothetical protein
MAEDSPNKAANEAEQKAVKEATQEYNDLVAALILIAMSNRSKKDKMSFINDWRSRMVKWNSEFASTQTDEVYRKFAEKALKEAKDLLPNLDLKKKTLSVQEEEIKNLSQQLKLGLDRRLDTLIDQARQLTIKQDLEVIREKKLGMKDASDRIQITPKKSVPNLVFSNQAGKIVKMDTVMKLTVGDQIWTTVTSSQRAQWLLMGFKFAQHISVIDDRTTKICFALHLTKRDLTKDQLPPMHPGCRSTVKLLKEGWNAAIFQKNFGKINLE